MDEHAERATAPGKRDDRHDTIHQSLTPKIIAEPLWSALDGETVEQPHDVIIELNLTYPGALQGARSAVCTAVKAAVGSKADADKALDRNLEGALHPYLFARLTKTQLYAVIAADGQAATSASDAPAIREAIGAVGPAVPHRTLRAIFRVWESTLMRPLATVSIRTVKADAAQTAYAALGNGVTWAVLDSGIQGDHPHFAQYKNLQIPPPLVHKNFVGDGPDALALTDAFGHGTHVAGIIAGTAKGAAVAAVASVDEQGRSGQYHLHDVSVIRGMAPQTQLLSLRVLNENGVGDVTGAINALEYVLQLNGYGQHQLVHGANISAGYLPDVRFYGTGQTPICRQIDRVVKSGVTVVVAAGNTGFVVDNVLSADNSTYQSEAGQSQSINDPGNAALAITVGSTHRERPHTYGISYFSSRGPTADGRLKPDVVAPGERIISCAAGTSKQRAGAALAAALNDQVAHPFDYIEDSGTSMAAPHVSGVIAAFLSIRPEYIGEAESLRDLVIASALDLKRDRYLQGAGLIDLIRLIESV